MVPNGNGNGNCSGNCYYSGHQIADVLSAQAKHANIKYLLAQVIIAETQRKKRETRSYPYRGLVDCIGLSIELNTQRRHHAAGRNDSDPFGTLPAATSRRKNSVKPARC
jgi:hypothetical protein